MDALKMNCATNLRIPTLDPVTRCRVMLPFCSTRLGLSRRQSHRLTPASHPVTRHSQSLGMAPAIGAPPSRRCLMDCPSPAELRQDQHQESAVDPSERRMPSERDVTREKTVVEEEVPRRLSLSMDEAGPSPVQFSAEVARRLTTRTRLRLLYVLTGEPRRGGQEYCRRGDRWCCPRISCCQFARRPSSQDWCCWFW